ncbi:hypothetical protein SAMN05444748_102461 [Variovorax sp. OV700]|nr:hypothetical protein SAMN05444748_102461 [Variovorax sp. OV700]
MSDDSQVELSELANRRIAYAAKVAELQYKQAKRICDEINGIPIGIDDPMVLAVLKAISTNYVALGHGAELRICSYPEAAEFDAQTRGSLSVADLVKVVDPSMFDGEIGSPEEVSWATELLVGVRHAGRGSGLSSGSPTKERREQALNLDNKTHRMR